MSDELLKIEAEHDKATASELLKEVCGGSLRKGMVEGDMKNGAVMVGQNVSAFKEISPAKEIIVKLVEQAKEINIDF